MRIAAFGDIHGNIYALRAVLADLRSQHLDALAVSGDLVYKLPWGAEVIDLLGSIPCQCILGNAELYLLLWDTPLWPASWNMPLAISVVQWERERLGAARLAWLATLPEHIAFSGRRLEDLLIVHGVPGNPFLAFLDRPGTNRSPWVQTDARIRQLLDGVDADVVVCGHTHTGLVRRIRNAERDAGTLVISPAGLSYGRGRKQGVGRAEYVLLDWSAQLGWQATLRAVTYDPTPLHRALLALRGDYPLAAYMANRMRPPGADTVPDERPDFVRYRWGDAPGWWERRDDLPDWRKLRASATG